MRQLEVRVRASGLDWTIVRPGWLFNAPAVTDYQTAEDSVGSMFTARADLAACLLAQLAGDRFVGARSSSSRTRVGWSRPGDRDIGH